MARPAVFLDRDGTITREVDHLRRVEQLRLLPGAAQAIRQLNEAGLAVVVLTNQSGIARGLLTEDEFCAIQEVLSARLAARGAYLDGVYYCPHHPEAPVARYRRECSGRKPAAGLVRRAAQELDLELARSFAIGDRARDLAPGHSFGCATVLVRTGYGKKEEMDWSEAWRPDHIARDLVWAVAWVLEHRD